MACHDTDDNIQRARSRMVVNPLHLQMRLDSIYETDEGNSVSCISRCAFWLAFSGMQTEEMPAVTAGDVLFSSMSVIHNGSIYVMYRESLNAFRKCVELTEFANKQTYLGNERMVTRKRCIGSQLLRTGVEMDKRRLISWISIHQDKPDTVRLSLTSVRMSGIFWRAYECELAGIHSLPAGYNRSYAQWKRAFIADKL